MKTPRLVVWLVVFAILLALPPALGQPTQNILGKMLIAGLFATGFGLLSGQAGLMSFGHAAFFGIGATMTMQAMIAVENGLLRFPTPLLPVIGGFAGALLAAAAGAIASRRTGSYFTLATLAIAELVHVVAIQWQPVFGGESGLTSMRMSWAGFNFATPLQVYYCILAWFVLCLLMVRLLTKTAFGQITLAIRENEERVRFVGFSTYRYKVLIFAFSGLFSGVAGGLLALSTESATYSLFGPTISLEVAFHTFIGGTALFLGPAVAAAVLTYLPYVLSGWTRLWPLYQGVLFMVLMYYAPTGLSGLVVAWQERGQKSIPVTWRLVGRIFSLLVLIGSFVFAVETTQALLANGEDVPSIGRWFPFVSRRTDLIVTWAFAGIAMAASVFVLKRIAETAAPNRKVRLNERRRARHQPAEDLEVLR